MTPSGQPDPGLRMSMRSRLAAVVRVATGMAIPLSDAQTAQEDPQGPADVPGELLVTCTDDAAQAIEHAHEQGTLPVEEAAAAFTPYHGEAPPVRAGRNGGQPEGNLRRPRPVRTRSNGTRPSAPFQRVGTGSGRGTGFTADPSVAEAEPNDLMTIAPRDEVTL